MLLNKILGCLYGQVIGDALGARYEFKDPYVINRQIQLDIFQNFLSILGGGPFNVDKGQCTDDSEMAFGLIKSILENRGYSKEKAAEKYIKWYRSHPFDIGNNTRKALAGATKYDDILLNNDASSLGNGCLMRISPLGILGVNLSDERLLKYCRDDCAMTNPNSIAVNAVQIYVLAIKYALRCKEDSRQNRELIYRKIREYCKHPIISEIVRRSFRCDPKYILSNGKELENAHNKCSGYIGIALQIALTELFHGKSFYDSLVNVMRRGGDTDTNGCITGALLGAYYGTSEIPNEWINTVKIDNWRSKQYPEIDQKNLEKIALKMYSIAMDINKKY